MKNTQTFIFSILLSAFIFAFSSCVLDPAEYQEIDFYVLNESSANIKTRYKSISTSGQIYSSSPKKQVSANANKFEEVAYIAFDLYADVGDYKNQAIIFEIYQTDLEGNETLIHKACGWPKSWQENPPENWTCCSKTYDKYGLGFIDYEQTGKTYFCFDNDDDGEFEKIKWLKYFITITDEEIQWETEKKFYLK